MATDDQNDQSQDDPSRLRQMMEDANARAAAAESKAARLEKENLFRDAGLDFTNRQHQAFVKAYDGDVETESIRAYVTDLGITQAAPAPPQTPPPPQGAREDEQEALIRMAEAARDGGGAPPPSPDRRAQLEREMDEAFRRKATPDELDHLSIEYSKAGGFPVATQD